MSNLKSLEGTLSPPAICSFPAKKLKCKNHKTGVILVLDILTATVTACVFTTVTSVSESVVTEYIFSE